MLYIGQLVCRMQEDDQAVLVAADIEHMQIAHLVYAAKLPSQCRKVSKHMGFHRPTPSL